MATAHLTPRFFHCKNHAAILSLHDSFTARFFHRYEKAIHKSEKSRLAPMYVTIKSENVSTWTTFASKVSSLAWNVLCSAKWAASVQRAVWPAAWARASRQAYGCGTCAVLEIAISSSRTCSVTTVSQMTTLQKKHTSMSGSLDLYPAKIILEKNDMNLTANDACWSVRPD